MLMFTAKCPIKRSCCRDRPEGDRLVRRTASRVVAGAVRALVVASFLLPAASVAATVHDRAEAWDPPRIVPLAEGESLPSPAELEQRGAHVRKIVVHVYDVFDTEDPRENNWIYRTANALHYRTRPSAIKCQLTFEEGELLVAARLAESERILRARRYLYDAVVRVARYDEVENRADIEVSVRDVWTLNPGVDYSQGGGTSKQSISLEDQNFLGRGQKLRFSYKSTVDRTTSEVEWINPNFRGSRWGVAIRYADLSDGETKYLDVTRPFYSLDTRWSAGTTAYDDSRVETRYDLGRRIDAYRLDSRRLDLRYGWSKGLEKGWARRWLVGLRSDETSYSVDPGQLAPPPEVIGERKFVYPWIGAEWVQDAYDKVRDRETIGRTEDAYRGIRFNAAIGYAGTGAGSTENALLFSAGFSTAREYGEGREWSLDASTFGRLESGALVDTAISAEAKHYWRLDQSNTFFASLTGVIAENPDLDHQVYLGSEEGLRGYPYRYQTGTSSALLTLEHRYYTDWYPFRLFHVGAAAFLDIGRTWGTTVTGTPPRGWLSDVGLGLRFGNSRSGLGAVTHVDFSYALSAVPGEDRFQISIGTHRGF